MKELNTKMDMWDKKFCIFAYWKNGPGGSDGWCFECQCCSPKKWVCPTHLKSDGHAVAKYHWVEWLANNPDPDPKELAGFPRVRLSDEEVQEAQDYVNKQSAKVEEIKRVKSLKKAEKERRRKVVRMTRTTTRRRS